MHMHNVCVVCNFRDAQCICIISVCVVCAVFVMHNQFIKSLALILRASRGSKDCPVLCLHSCASLLVVGVIGVVHR